jgi:hypothetical protein
VLELNSTAGSGRPGPKESEISLQKAFRIRPALRMVRMEDEGGACRKPSLPLDDIFQFDFVADGNTIHAYERYPGL